MEGVNEKRRKNSSRQLDDLIAGSILRALTYFDLFDYPLLREEIIEFMDQPAGGIELETGLNRLIESRIIFSFHNFFSIRDNALLAARRAEGNRRADELLPRAVSAGKFLTRFPFVRAIAISGSLSKHFADEKADVDYFIIAKTNRLWVARSFMHLFKKFTYLFGRQHYYCMNFYLDESALVLQHRNIFTAIELKTLIPVGGSSALEHFSNANDWTNHFLPCWPLSSEPDKKIKNGWGKQLIEWLLMGRVGDWLDNYLMKKTVLRWQRKAEKGRRNVKGKVMGMVTGKHYAWSNPESFEDKVLTEYERRLEELQSRIPFTMYPLNTSFAG